MADFADTLPEVTVYTDGACSPNPGPGGWGAVILAKGQRPRELSGFVGETTNNRMELTAALSVLKSFDCPQRIVLYTDSQYVKNGITSWIANWQRKNWQTADRKPVKNDDLWKELLREIEQHDITWKWVRGHALNRWNERADELAVAARKSRGAANLPMSNAAAQTGDEIHLYTGVTCKHSTGIGGWAVILSWRNHMRILGDRVEGLTANQLYLHATIAALESLKKPFPVHVHTHSGYLRDGASTWLKGWSKRNWKTREGNPVSNIDQWQKLSGLLTKFEVIFQLDDRDNPLCHMLEAKELAREFELEV